MKLLLSSLLLGSLCTISSRGALFTDFVTQTPDVSVAEGGDLNITCCIKSTADRIRATWLINKTEIRNRDLIFNKPAQNSSSPFCSTLTILNITIEKSGRYICNLTLEKHLAYQAGNGIIVTVVPSASADRASNHSSNLPVILAVVVVGLLLLVTIGGYSSLRIRHGSAQAATVIYEVPHVDSEEANMDKHSTGSSTGSSQWCQVLVYESFEYFEGLQSKSSE